MTRNPHFDDDRVLWSDSYSGAYLPVAYHEQFDDQWRLFLEKKTGFYRHTGVETEDIWIDQRISEITGEQHFLLKMKWGALAPLALFFRHLVGPNKSRLAVGGELHLVPKFSPDFFIGKKCLDAGCGAGRWSRVLDSLGGIVTALDVSEHALISTRRYVQDVRKVSIFDIPTAEPSLKAQFDFVICWGVLMCTHDPKLAFESVASAVKPGGSIYIMVYAPTYHISDKVLGMRKEFHENCHTFEEKLEFAYLVSNEPDNAINYLDMLNTFYNWVIDDKTITGWLQSGGFKDIIFLNADEKSKCAHHVVAVKI